MKGVLCVEINSGQMLEDVRLSVEGSCPVAHHGRMGGMVPTPEEIVQALKEQLMK
jgi:2-oxoglutarate ferredoxin oxidoreductase subunit alpha